MPEAQYTEKNKFYDSPEKYYDTIADTYDSGKKKNPYYFESLVSLYTSIIPQQSNVLEIGSGTGDLITRLSVKKGVGFDISKEMVRVAQNKYSNLKNIEYIRHDIKESNEPLDFNFIVLADVLEHVPNLQSFMNQLSLRTPKNTKVIISVLNPIWEWLMMIVEKLNMKVPEGPHVRFTVKDSEEIFKKAGFNIEKRGYRLLVPKKIPFSDFVNKHFYKNRFLARYGFTLYWILSK